jgi:hypothetical protein
MKFMTAGDPGSLPVQDVSTNPRSIGLLFIGTSTYPFANPWRQHGGKVRSHLQN